MAGHDSERQVRTDSNNTGNDGGPVRRRTAGVGSVPAAILAQQRAAGNRAVASALGSGTPVVQREPVVQRQPDLTGLPTDILSLMSIRWHDFVTLRAVDRAHRDMIDGLVRRRYGQCTPENMLTFWAIQLRELRQSSIFGIVNLAKDLGEQALWPAFWRLVAQAHVPSKAKADNIDIMLALGQKFDLAGSIDFIADIVDLAYSSGYNHLAFLTSYLDAWERSEAAEVGVPEARKRRKEIEQAMDLELGTGDEKGDVYYDAAISSMVPSGDGGEHLETSDVLLRWVRRDAEEATGNRKSDVLAKRLAKQLRDLDGVLGQGRGKQSGPDTPVPLLRYVQRALSQAEWETLTELHVALVQLPKVSIVYEGACRNDLAGADDLLAALTALSNALEIAREEDEARRRERAARKDTKPREPAHEKKTRERWERHKLEAAKPKEEEKAGPSTMGPDPVPSHDPDDDGRTGEEATLRYRGVAYDRFASKRYGRVDRGKLASRFTGEQLAEFERAVRHGLAMRDLGESGVKQRGEYYQVKLSTADARSVDINDSGEARLRSARAISETPADGYEIKYFVFDRKDTAHGGGHI